MTIQTPSRRAFLKASATAAGGVLFSFALPQAVRAHVAHTGIAGRNPDAAEITAFLRIEPDNTITFLNPFIEMGEGTYTAIPQIVAEELDASMEQFVIEQAPHGAVYQILDFGGQPIRFTGGSYSVRGSYMTMRQVGAGARAMLIEAAAQRFGVEAGELTTDAGTVLHEASGQKATYGELAGDVAGLTPPDEVSLKDPADFTLIGQSIKRTDSLAKSTGKAWFGIDTRLDGMVYAAVRHCPTLGGSLASVNAASIEGMPGNPQVVELESAVVVVADSYWRAKSAVEALEVTWDDGPGADISSEALVEEVLGRVDEAGIEAENEGDAAAALAEADSALEAVYVQPFLAHATMEPMNCAAWVQADRCDVWAPNQGADFVAMTASGITGLGMDQIHVHTPYLGGGFGRRFVLDYVGEAVTVAKAVGKPVQLIWSREEDTQHDFYRPLAAIKLRAGFDADKKPTALHISNVSDGPGGRLVPGMVDDRGLDPTAVEGLIHQPYQIANKRCDFIPAGYATVPVGFWRSVGHVLNAFPKESFIDEMAHEAGQDPVAFRLALLAEGSNERALVEKVRDMASYREGVYEVECAKRAMGVAQHESFGSLVAQIAEVGIEGGRPVVHKVWCAIDLGQVVNPGIVQAQLMGGIAYGLSATLYEEVTIENGQVQNGNFDSYPFLPQEEMPAVVSEIVTSDRTMGGVGEPGTPPIAPAVCNALFKLTGERIRRLPLSRYTFQDV
ncbi:MAG: molybdopterin cofactor-binding domain-containing protein [Geminicoccaceae bacterium]